MKQTSALGPRPEVSYLIKEALESSASLILRFHSRHIANPTSGAILKIGTHSLVGAPVLNWSRHRNIYDSVGCVGPYYTYSVLCFIPTRACAMYLVFPILSSIKFYTFVSITILVYIGLTYFNIGFLLYRLFGS